MSQDVKSHDAKILKRIAVFCGSRPGTDPIYGETATALGRRLAERGLGLVYGGGKVGLMGMIADAVLEAGGEVIGVIPQSLEEREVAHRGLSRLHVVDSMHDRKALMYHLSDAMVALPGGIGTFDEFFEALTWNQLGLHDKPCGLLNVAGYYDPLVAMIGRAHEKGYVSAWNRFLLIDDDGASLLDRLLERQGELS